MSKIKNLLLLLLPVMLLAMSTPAQAEKNYWVGQAETGNPQAQFDLGYMYLWGMKELGILQSNEQAYKWFRQAAEQGHAEAQFEVGVSLKYGRGVKADPKAAETWFAKAAAQGFKGKESVRSGGAGRAHGGGKQDTSVPPAELPGMVMSLDKDSIMQSMTEVQFFNGWWTWWLGAIGLAFVTVGFWFTNRVTLGVSSSWDRIVSWRDDAKLAEADAMMRATPADDLAAAMMAETLAEFGDEIPDDMKQSLMKDSSSAAPAPAKPERTRWTVHVTFLLAFVVGGFVGYVPAGDWQLRMDMGPDFVRLFGDGPESMVALVVGGMLIGFGTRLGGGCTSGHALSGCSRFQGGSLIGTAAFFGTAIVVSILLDIFLG